MQPRDGTFAEHTPCFTYFYVLNFLYFALNPSFSFLKAAMVAMASPPSVLVCPCTVASPTLIKGLYDFSSAMVDGIVVSGGDLALNFLHSASFAITASLSGST